jgi:hypothetical protein
VPAQSPVRTAIDTPVELDLAARETQRRIARSASPLLRFQLLIDFARRTAHLPAVWTSTYLRGFYPVFSASVRHEYVRWLDPDDWRIALETIRTLESTDWARAEASFEETAAAVWKKCTMTLAGMYAFRELHELLLAHNRIEAVLTAQEWSAILNADTVRLDPFGKYRDILLRHGDCPQFLLRACAQWEHERADGRYPGVILLTESGYDSPPSGFVLHIDIGLQKSTVTRAHFRNPLEKNNSETMRQLADAAEAATSVARRHFGGGTPIFEWTVGFHEYQASYSGQSMGISTALAMTWLIQKDLNRDVRWELRPNLVCSGGIEADGRVKELPRSILHVKVAAAFFSPADALVLPAENAEEARVQVLRLQQRYPARRLDVFGVSSLDDCVAAPGIMRTVKRTVYDRTKEFAKRNLVLLLALLVLVLAATGMYFWWKSLYGYPDLEFTRAAPIEENALVYNPHRARDWQFRDYDRVVESILPFGDLEIGADATRNVFIWNMTPSDLDVLISIEGPDADQWYISWHGGRQSVNATDSLRVMVKYAPTRASASNEASFTVRSPDDGSLLTSLALTGAAGPPLPAGYALALDGVDDMLFFGEQAIAFARDEATIECWLRMDERNSTILSNDRNVPQGPAKSNMALSYAEGTFGVQIGNSHSEIPLAGRAFAGDGRWHHVALAFSRPLGRIRLMLDGETLLERTEEFIIEHVASPFVTFGAYNNGESVRSPMRGGVDEFRVWSRMLPADTVRARMRTKVSGLAPGLLGYWDFNIVAEVSAHNANERTQDGLLIGRPSYIRSGVPLDANGTDIRLVPGPLRARAVELQSCRWLQCGSDPIAASPARSYAIRFRRDDDPSPVILTVMNQDAYFILDPASISIDGNKPLALPSQEGWNSFVCRIDEQQNLVAFMNGTFLPTTSSPMLRRGPSYRYEGLEIGIYNDKYNNFGSKSYDDAYPRLRKRRAVTDFRVWNRRISDAAIAAYERGEATPEGLVARWPLDTLPDRNGNYRDRVNGHILHLWRYPVWE